MIKQYIPTERFIFTDKTRLGADNAAGASSLTVKNSAGFAANGYVMIGYEGQDETTVSQINAITDSTTIDFTGDTITFAHQKNEPIRLMLYNQRKLYGCATEDGTYVLVETKDIEVDNPLGTYMEDTGSTYLFFKATYYNEETTVETSQDDTPIFINETTEQQVVDDDGRYATIIGIRKEAGFENNDNIDDFRVSQARMRAENVIDGYIGNVYTLPLSEVPGMIRLTAEKLAAAYLLQEEYGADSRGTDKDGYNKENAIIDTILKIKEKEILLFDEDGSLLPTATTQRLWYYPNDEDTQPERFTYDFDTQTF